MMESFEYHDKKIHEWLYSSRSKREQSMDDIMNKFDRQKDFEEKKECPFKPKIQ